MTSIELLAPAKVNIFLKILNKRKDSYHNILTLFERISLADRIRISKIPKGIEVSSDRFITRSRRHNLVYKAAKLILEHKKVKGGVSIRIKKRIPIAAGLGGGSSDAATTLIGINRLYGLGLGKDVLARLASRLGADVPFFISGAPFAVGRSRGDALGKISYNNRIWHMIIAPSIKVSTRDIYEAHDFGLTTGEGDDKIQPPFLARPMDFDALEEMLSNDLQKTVVGKKKVIGKIIERLASSLGKRFIVSGSGPSVFCLWRTRKEATAARKRLLSRIPAAERKGWRVLIAGTAA